ncbi:hypothetical protein ACTHSU_11110, partial [Neisseria sp. P0009.S005]|uniref:hypothetical protein n=1 Tax=Neisseria sp. P0009.S005 TaxID=3436712 RepID=UPI003F7F3706
NICDSFAPRPLNKLGAWFFEKRGNFLIYFFFNNWPPRVRVILKKILKNQIYINKKKQILAKKVKKHLSKKTTQQLKTQQK